MKKIVLLSLLALVSCNPLAVENQIENSLYCSGNARSGNYNCGLAAEQFMSASSVPFNEMGDNAIVIVKTDGDNYFSFLDIKHKDSNGASCIIEYEYTAFATFGEATSGYNTHAAISTAMMVDTATNDVINSFYAGLGCVLEVQGASLIGLLYKGDNPENE
jgi:hypothetical protein